MASQENQDKRLPEGENPTVDLSELRIEFARSGGAGGQNVNKRSTKAVLHWNVGTAKGFSEDQKTAIREFGANRLNNEDEIVMHDQTERSQEQNKNNVIERLQQLVADALVPEKERKATRVPRSQKNKRLDEKFINKRRKADRSTKGEY